MSRFQYTSSESEYAAAMDSRRRQRLAILAGAAAVALCAQAVVLTLSQNEKAHWDNEETSALVHYLFTNRSDSRSGTFKAATYDNAANYIAPYLVQGPEKTSKMCKAKWTALKRIYIAIEMYRTQPGFHWDNDHGAGIEGQAATDIWNTYVRENKRNSLLRPFCNQGWSYYEKVQATMRTRGSPAPTARLIDHGNMDISDQEGR